MTITRRILLAVAGLTTVLIIGLNAIYIDPVKGTIVDAVTGRPVQGVRVLFNWKTFIGGPGGSSAGGSLLVYEATTDQKGRFKTPWFGIRWIGIGDLDGRYSPLIVLFKPGYEVEELTNDPYKNVVYLVSRSEWDGSAIKLKQYRDQDIEDVLHSLSSAHTVVSTGMSESSPRYEQISRGFLEALVTEEDAIKCAMVRAAVARDASVPHDPACDDIRGPVGGSAIWRIGKNGQPILEVRSIRIGEQEPLVTAPSPYSGEITVQGSIAGAHADALVFIKNSRTNQTVELRSDAHGRFNTKIEVVRGDIAHLRSGKIVMIPGEPEAVMRNSPPEE